MAGSIFTKESVASQLEEANKNYYGQRTWANLFGNIDLSKQVALENLTTGYGSTIGQSFASAKANESNIMASNLGQGYKNALLESNEAALEEAYNSYLQNYRNEAQDIESIFAQQRDVVNKELLSQADYTARYGNAHYGYLQELFKRYEEGENTLFDDPNYAKYTNNVDDILSLKGLSEIENLIFDKDGNLNRAGVDFFDQLEHDDLLYDYSFGDYLRETDEELYNWSVSENPYNFAINARGLNINDATFREMVGQSSIDEQYSFLERAYGMNDGEIKKLFNTAQKTVYKINDILDQQMPGRKMVEELGAVDSDRLKNATNEFIDELTVTINELGLNGELNLLLEEKGYSNLNDYFNAQIDDYLESVKSFTPAQTKAYESSDSKYKNKMNKKYNNAFIGALNKGKDSIVYAIEQTAIMFTPFYESDDIAEWEKILNESSKPLKETYNGLLSSLINRAISKSKI